MKHRDRCDGGTEPLHRIVPAVLGSFGRPGSTMPRRFTSTKSARRHAERACRSQADIGIDLAGEQHGGRGEVARTIRTVGSEASGSCRDCWGAGPARCRRSRLRSAGRPRVIDRRGSRAGTMARARLRTTSRRKSKSGPLKCATISAGRIRGHDLGRAVVADIGMGKLVNLPPPPCQAEVGTARLTARERPRRA